MKGSKLAGHYDEWPINERVSFTHKESQARCFGVVTEVDWDNDRVQVGTVWVPLDDIEYREV